MVHGRFPGLQARPTDGRSLRALHARAGSLAHFSIDADIQALKYMYAKLGLRLESCRRLAERGNTSWEGPVGVGSILTLVVLSQCFGERKRIFFIRGSILGRRFKRGTFVRIAACPCFSDRP